jgi:CheY-like chemotaxis protein
MPALTTHLVLLVEDAHDTRDLVEKKLLQLGHRVLKARTVNEAKSLIDMMGHKITCLITDTHLPDGHGKLVLDYLRRIRYTPAIALTPPILSSNFLRLIESGFSMALERDIAPKMLGEAIDTFTPMLWVTHAPDTPNPNKSAALDWRTALLARPGELM